MNQLYRYPGNYLAVLNVYKLDHKESTSNKQMPPTSSLFVLYVYAWSMGFLCNLYSIYADNLYNFCAMIYAYANVLILKELWTTHKFYGKGLLKVVWK